MGLSLSIEVTIPDGVDSALLIDIGERCYPYDIEETMEIDEALQWAFSTPQGVTELAILGVRWNAQHQ
jgi:hypothetical protein